VIVREHSIYDFPCKDYTTRILNLTLTLVLTVTRYFYITSSRW